MVAVKEQQNLLVTLMICFSSIVCPWAAVTLCDHIINYQLSATSYQTIPHNRQEISSTQSAPTFE